MRCTHPLVVEERPRAVLAHARVRNVVPDIGTARSGSEDGIRVGGPGERSHRREVLAYMVHARHMRAACTPHARRMHMHALGDVHLLRCRLDEGQKAGDTHDRPFTSAACSERGVAETRSFFTAPYLLGLLLSLSLSLIE